jgi:uncharacterized cupin superfamily protein
MIIGTPEQIPGEYASGSHGGQGPYFVRTLLSDPEGCTFKYVREICLPPGSTVGLHPHVGSEEVYFIFSGAAVMVVDGEERTLGPGSAVLTRSGSTHGLRNEGTEDLRMFVACARTDY